MPIRQAAASSSWYGEIGHRHHPSDVLVASPGPLISDLLGGSGASLSGQIACRKPRVYCACDRHTPRRSRRQEYEVEWLCAGSYGGS
jgi:hypothetical protein